MRIEELYQLLKDNPSGHSFTVTPLQEWDGIYLGIDLESRPCLFISAQEASQQPALRTAQISLRLGVPYTLSVAGGSPQQGLFHSICCETAERIEVETFLLLVEAFLAHQRGKQLCSDNLTAFFGSMLRLFSISPARDLKSERQGLWGELFVMSRIRGFSFWAPLWHSEVTRTFDFSSPGKRLEVKTTIGQQRIHQFAHRQVFALDKEEIMIASLLLREDDSGLSLRDLINPCRTDLRDSPYFIKLEKAVRRAGMDQSTEPGPIFDPAEAERELAFFRSSDAPHFTMAEPHGVSETRYRIDLSTAPQLSSQELDSWLNTWPAQSDRNPQE